MSKVWLLTIEDGRLKFSDYQSANFRDYVKEYPKAKFRLTPEKKPVSEEMRGYYFGAVIPELRKTCNEWKGLSGEDLHNIIKKMLFHFEAYNPITKRTERFGRSVMSDDEWNNTEKAMNFLETIRSYLEDCGHDMPDSEDYKRWRDSAPLPDETYKR